MVTNDPRYRVIYCDTLNVGFVYEFCAIELLDIKDQYRSYFGHYDWFFTNLETFLNNLTVKTNKLVMFGYFNVNFLSNSSKLLELMCLLNFFNLKGTGEDYTKNIVSPMISDHYEQTNFEDSIKSYKALQKKNS